MVFILNLSKNSNRTIGAYVHNDEATAHLHLDYIPFASYSRGMTLRVANDRAIEQMGYKSWRMERCSI